MTRRLVVRFGMVVSAALLAVPLGAAWIRTPVMWPAIPGWLWSLSDAIQRPRSQEAVADREFIVFWLVSWLAMLAVVGLARRTAGWLASRAMPTASR